MKQDEKKMWRCFPVTQSAADVLLAPLLELVMYF